jgi:uncharacterized protein (TIGR00369 family)
MNSVNMAANRPSSDGTTSIGVPEAQSEPGRLGGGSGLDLLRAMVAGEVLPPPAMTLLGIELVLVRDGGATLRRKAGDDLYNPMGPVHGSAVAALFDLALGSAIQSALPAGRTYTTLDTRISYLRPVTAASGTLTVAARTVDVRERQAAAEAQLTDADGRACATATMTGLVVESLHEGASDEPGRTWDVSDWFKIS